MWRLLRIFDFVHRELFTNIFSLDRIRVVLFRSLSSRNKAPDMTSNNFNPAGTGPPGGAAARRHGDCSGQKSC